MATGAKPVCRDGRLNVFALIAGANLKSMVFILIGVAMYDTQEIADNIEAGIRSGRIKAEAKRYRCSVCGCKLIIADGYHGIGMCGPCYTGESEALDEKGISW